MVKSYVLFSFSCHKCTYFLQRSICVSILNCQTQSFVDVHCLLQRYFSIITVVSIRYSNILYNRRVAYLFISYISANFIGRDIIKITFTRWTDLLVFNFNFLNLTLPVWANVRHRLVYTYRAAHKKQIFSNGLYNFYCSKQNKETIFARI